MITLSWYRRDNGLFLVRDVIPLSFATLDQIQSQCDALDIDCIIEKVSPSCPS